MNILPAAAKRHEQARDVDQAIAVRLGVSDHRQQVSLLRIKHRQHADAADAQLPAHDVEVLPGHFFCIGGRLDRLRVGLDRPQRVGDVLKRGDDGLAASLKTLKPPLALNVRFGSRAATVTPI